MKRKNLLGKFSPGALKTQEAIQVLKRQFLLNDIRYKGDLENGKHPIVDLSVSNIQTEVVVGKSIVKSIDDLGFEEDEVVLDYEHIEVDFYEEFKEALDNILMGYCKKFELELEKKGVYTRNDLEGFKGMKLKRINELIKYVTSSSPIEYNINKHLVEFYNNLYDFIFKFRFEDSQVDKKLKFKLKKTHLIWLFLAMYEQGLIKGMSNLDLYAFLENNTMYFDSRKGEYVDMINVRIQANKLIKGDVSPTDPTKVLEQKFHSNFFKMNFK